MPKRTKKKDELPPSTLIGLMDAEMGAKPIGQTEIQKPAAPGFSEFQRGALWALRLLQDQMNERQDELRKFTFATSELSQDEAGMLSALRNVYGGIKIKLEGELSKRVRDAEKEFKL